jgi:hypothetical protein
VTSRRLTATLALLLIAIPACRRETAGEDINSRIRKTPPPRSSGTCDFDLSGDKEVAVFRMLGMLDESLGRHIAEDSDVVERFYPSEAEIAAVFGHTIERVAREQQLESPRTATDDGFTSIRSKALTERINSCYAYEMTNGELFEGPNREMLRSTSASLSQVLFMRSGVTTADPAGGESDNTFRRQRALAYLSGAWRRYQRGADFFFYAKREKAALVGQLLFNLGARQVTIESTLGLIPGGHMVHFTPTGQVREELDKPW